MAVGTALGIAGLITSLIGSGVSAGSKIAKSKKEDAYLKKVEEAQKKEERRQELMRRRNAIASYLGQGKNQSIIDPYRGRIGTPRTPYLRGYDIGSGLGTLGAQYAPQIFDQIGRMSNAGSNVLSGVGGAIGSVGR